MGEVFILDATAT